MPEGLSNRLKEERARRGWTQAELADRAGVSRKTINTVENGVFIPSTILALRLARVLARPVEELFALVDEGSD
ncbi:helix-turn-helix transcriptional regulator [Sphingomonas abietis]|uniref:Helix-turn-helix transcriptional regulator n=1 Tax=Sphingomonas abietis TaxID=3012344 RepID=A0ABY7NPG5_9SPHN|nr:helix-turn-helix transcriptional regulator [Sphingomonas abietis]WBO22366.1 helix-turn-helix transcriptional regulator [Sphingomonas abietis]